MIAKTFYARHKVVHRPGVSKADRFVPVRGYSFWADWKVPSFVYLLAPGQWRACEVTSGLCFGWGHTRRAVIKQANFRASLYSKSYFLEKAQAACLDTGCAPEPEEVEQCKEKVI